MNTSSIKSITNKLLAGIGFNDYKLSVDKKDNRFYIQIDLPQNDSGMLIGFHGEKIEALKTVLSLMINQPGKEFVPVQVNVNDYRENRQQAVEDLAEKAAEKALSSMREILLPPLPSNERRLVHLYLQNRDDITTYSEGVGNQRRVIVSPVSEVES